MGLFIHVPFQLPGEHTSLQPWGAGSLSYKNCHLCPIRYPFTHVWSETLEGKMTQHVHNIGTTMSLRWEGRNMIFFRKSHTRRALNSCTKQRLIAMRYALTIEPRPSYIVASELKDPICHSNECQIGSFNFKYNNVIWVLLITLNFKKWCHIWKVAL